METKIKLIFLITVIFFSNCKKEEIGLPKAFGTIKADLNGVNWDTKDYIVQVGFTNWNKVPEPMPCLKDKIDIFVQLYEKNFGYSRFGVGFKNISPIKGIYTLQVLDLSQNACESAHYPYVSASHSEADGDVRGSYYIQKEGVSSTLEIIECDFNKHILKGKFTVHLIQPYGGPFNKSLKYPEELIFTNGEFETTIY